METQLDPASERARALVGLLVATNQRAGLRLLRGLESLLGPIETWWRDRRSRLRESGGADGSDALLCDDLDRRATAVLDRIARLGFRAVEASRWPRVLSLPDPPAVLFQRGEARPCERALAVVGARRASAYGLRVTRALVEGVSSAGVAILSGLARGIDARAHESALDAGGHTLAVLGCGPDRAYPPENRALQERIGRDGVLLSEYLPGTPPLAGYFPRRNRILVALADAVLVVEARRRSGTLTSAGWAADLGREVLVVPGPVDSELSEGPIALLREGATPVASVDHVIEALGMEALRGSPAGERPARSALSDAEERIVALFGGGPLDMDELLRISGDPPSRVLTMVLSLETRGVLVRESDGRTFRLERK